jgi:hypothetical protein
MNATVVNSSVVRATLSYLIYLSLLPKLLNLHYTIFSSTFQATFYPDPTYHLGGTFVTTAWHVLRLWMVETASSYGG